MKQINLSYAKGTGFDPFFDNMRSITVDDSPFAGGGFGDIYHAKGFNGGKQPKLRQVIKVFKPSTIGKDDHSWNTITRLQKKLMEEMALFEGSGQDFLEQFPALLAMPQFVFEGTLDGRKVRGYATNNLNDLGLVAFDKVIDEEDSPYLDEFVAKDMKWRFTAAYHLVRGFNVLDKMHFLHADISADNVFVSLTQPICVILDFDSGAVVETMDDNPSTFGKFQPWLAPEIGFQLSSGQATDGNMLVEINSFTDRWSVANALLNLLLMMPAYYLKDMSENSLRSYIKKYTWPEANFRDSLFDADNEEAYRYFREVFDNLLPEDVQREFVATFSQGVFMPTVRATYSRWELIFKKLIPKEVWGKNISVKGGVSIPSYGGAQSSKTFCIGPYDFTQANKEELKKYINSLVFDVVSGEEKISHHEFFINDMAKKAGLDGKQIVEELEDFVDLYKDCVADKVITKFELSTLLAQGELAMVSENSINRLLKPYRRV